MYIRSIADHIEVLTLQAANIATYGALVGATPEDIQDITEDLANLEWYVDRSNVTDENKKTTTGVKNAADTGDPNEELTKLPVSPVGDPPFPNRKAGARTRTNDRGRRFRAAPGYTPQIGDALGLTEDAGPVDPGVVNIHVFGAQMGNVFTVVVENRGESASNATAKTCPTANRQLSNS